MLRRGPGGPERRGAVGPSCCCRDDALVPSARPAGPAFAVSLPWDLGQVSPSAPPGLDALVWDALCCLSSSPPAVSADDPGEEAVSLQGSYSVTNPRSETSVDRGMRCNVTAETLSVRTRRRPGAVSSPRKPPMIPLRWHPLALQPKELRSCHHLLWAIPGDQMTPSTTTTFFHHKYFPRATSAICPAHGVLGGRKSRRQLGLRPLCPLSYRPLFLPALGL